MLNKQTNKKTPKYLRKHKYGPKTLVWLGVLAHTLNPSAHEDFKFKPSLDNTVSSRSTSSTQRDLVSKILRHARPDGVRL